MQDVLNFGRSGAGAPVKDSSGKVKAVVVGNPEIRFQENEGVQKSIQNAIRYHADPDLKSQYHADLGELIVKLTSELGLTITTATVLADSCPIWTDSDRDLLHSFSFWVEGICQG